MTAIELIKRIDEGRGDDQRLLSDIAEWLGCTKKLPPRDSDRPMPPIWQMYDGSFALALYDRLTEHGVTARFAVACVGNLAVKPTKLFWRHALVEVDGRLYDIEGEVLAEHVLENYCWGSISRTRGLVTLNRDDFLRLVMSTNNAFDGEYLVRWRQQLRMPSYA